MRIVGLGMGEESRVISDGMMMIRPVIQTATYLS